MPKKQSHLRIDHRKFLQRLAIAGSTITVGYILYEYQPWLNYDSHADLITRHLDGVG
jgi:hypothetical protein